MPLPQDLRSKMFAKTAMSHLQLALANFAQHATADGLRQDERILLVSLSELLQAMLLGNPDAPSKALQLYVASHDLNFTRLSTDRSAVNHDLLWDGMLVPPESHHIPCKRIDTGFVPRDAWARQEAAPGTVLSCGAERTPCPPPQNFDLLQCGQLTPNALQPMQGVGMLAPYLSKDAFENQDSYPSTGDAISLKPTFDEVRTLEEAVGWRPRDSAAFFGASPSAFNLKSLKTASSLEISEEEAERKAGLAATAASGASALGRSVATGPPPSPVGAQSLPTTFFDSSPEQWQQQLMDLFYELDADGSGDIDNTELRKALTAVGVTPARSMKMLQLIDTDGDGRIDQHEWDNVIQKLRRKDAPNLIREFMKALIMQKMRHGHIYHQRHWAERYCFFRYNSGFRTAWDLVMTLLLFYVALALPFTLAFSSRVTGATRNRIDDVELGVDCFFILDILLNFRTSYVNSEGKHVTNPRFVACHYLRTWFALDVLSSMPIDRTFDALPDLAIFRLLKLGKIAKALKVLRVGRLLRRIDIADHFEDWLTGSTFLMKSLSLIVTTFCVCHWMACFCVAASDGEQFDEYFKKIYQNTFHSSVHRQYLASMYWALTTMTTVGYGDITPVTDGERLFVCFSMIVGGTFYGYVIGCITSLVSRRDANARAYHEKMSLVAAWLEFHSELPSNVVRRIRRHFKQILTEKTALADSEILNELSPELRCDVSTFIICDDVRFNLLFEDLPGMALALLVPSLQTTNAEVNESIVRENEPGVAMFIILEGTATWSSLLQQSHRSLAIGDSFGEEVVLGLEQRYFYTVVATSKVNLHMIPIKAFSDAFKNLPDIMADMRQNYMNSRPSTFIDIDSNRKDSNRKYKDGGGAGQEPNCITNALDEILCTVKQVLDRQSSDHALNREPTRSSSLADPEGTVASVTSARSMKDAAIMQQRPRRADSGGSNKLSRDA